VSEIVAQLSLIAAGVPEGHTLDTRRGRLVVCGDCGPSVSIRDLCQWCEGFAEPYHHPINRTPRRLSA
jgi:hypothetical protein